MHWIAFPDPRIQVCGLPWFSETAPRLWRFPERLKPNLPEDVFLGGKETAGVRLRLRTDTGSLSVKALFPKFSVRTNMTQFTAHGISAYVDGRCWSARIPGGEGGESEISLFDGVSRRTRDICLYLPLYGPIEILSVGVDEGAAFEDPTPFAVERPVVFYGTSITQGGCASRPGLSYQAVLGRELNLDYANFGFSGKGRCEREVAEALSGIEASCFVLDAGQNSGLDDFRERFGPFMEVLREARPDTPVLATTPIFYNAELWSGGHIRGVEAKRETVRAAVERRRRAGDGRVHLLEAKDYLGSDVTDGAVDGGHPNDLGFARMAAGMAPRLAEILGIGKR
jgi:lysophospholipase L1-like esterase